MKLQKEYGILIAVICILVIVLILGTDRNKMSYELPKLDKIESDLITRLEINHPEESILIKKSQDKWKIMPQGYAADPNKINDMLDVIGNLTLTELVSDKENYSRYELDKDNRIQIKAFNDGELIREFYIGKASPTYSHTYVRMASGSDVFHARDSFRSTFEQNVSGLRDKLVMEFVKQEITGMVFKGDFGSLELNKEISQVEPDAKEQPQEDKEISPSEEEIWITPDGTKAETSEINSLLSKLSSLKCDSYLEEEEKSKLQDPIYTVTARGAKDYKLRIYQNKKEEDEYPALSSENGYPFLLTKYTAESLIKKPEELLKKESED